MRSAFFQSEISHSLNFSQVSESLGAHYCSLHFQKIRNKRTDNANEKKYTFSILSESPPWHVRDEYNIVRVTDLLISTLQESR